MSAHTFATESEVVPPDYSGAPPRPSELTIGAFIRGLRKLNDRQIDQILSHQRKHRLRFGEAAVALELASQDDVLWALSQQFDYPYAIDAVADALSDELVAALHPFSDLAETFRDIRSQLLAGVLAPDIQSRAIAVVSPAAGDGRSFFAANLAISFSQLGGRTLLVDADMRAPRQHELFRIPNRTGLSNLLAGRAECNVIHDFGALPNLSVLPVGTVPPNPVELIQRPAFNVLLREFITKFDYVIVDTPAASLGADSRLAAIRCGASLMVCRRGISSMNAMHHLTQQLLNAHVRHAGVVINDK